MKKTGIVQKAKNRLEKKLNRYFNKRKKKKKVINIYIFYIKIV